jgi:hypothetical protein
MGNVGRFRLIPQGMRLGRGTAREVECSGMIEQSAEDPRHCVVTLAIVRARHGWRNRGLVLVAFTAGFALFAIAGAQWQRMLLLLVVGPGYVGLTEFTLRDQARRLRPALEEMIQGLAEGKLGAPVA